MSIDGREATLSARDYFIETSGQYSVLGFAVEEVTYDDNVHKWTVKCSYFPGFVSFKEYYQVDVDDDGKILKVSKIAPPTPRP